MRLRPLSATAFLGLTVWGSAACATPIEFGFTGSLITFTVPTAGSYQILAFGGQGGSGSITLPDGVVATGPGGLGAEIGGDFNLSAGEVLQIAVGEAGANFANGGGGGGGGSFVVGSDNNPLVIAGGGGGGGANFNSGSDPGQGGLTGPDGGGSSGGFGTGGNGGAAGGVAGGAGGGGFLTAGASGIVVSTGGGAFPSLAGGELGGGFGAGGGAFGGAGGGGGYSGGAGGFGRISINGSGFGGGSFDAGIDQILMADFQTGNGEVVITPTPIPEPAPIALIGAGLLSLAALRPRRR